MVNEKESVFRYDRYSTGEEIHVSNVVETGNLCEQHKAFHRNALQCFSCHAKGEQKSRLMYYVIQGGRR